MKERFTVAIVILKQIQVGNPLKNSAWVDAEQVCWNSIDSYHNREQAEAAVDGIFNLVGKVSELPQQSASRVLKGLFCLRCDHSWTPRQSKTTICPKCKSPYWNSPRKQGVDSIA